VKINTPAVVGVPVMAPVLPFRFSPDGSDPEEIEKLYGGTPPVAVRAELYATLTCPVEVGPPITRVGIIIAAATAAPRVKRIAEAIQ
jgi:hypothetical protein